MPILNYCSSVWSPHLISDVLAIESVQRLFTRRLPGFELLTYVERLSRLNLPTLELRRLRSDLTLCYKIIHGHVNSSSENYGIKLASNFVTRGHSQKLVKFHSRIDARLHYFGSRVVDPWNSLSEAAVNAISINCFKAELFKCDLSSFLTINV